MFPIIKKMLDLPSSSNKKSRALLTNDFLKIKIYEVNNNIFIKNIELFGKNLYSNKIESNDTIKNVIESIYYKMGILPESQRLLFNSFNGNKELYNIRTLNDNNIQKEDTIYIWFKKATCDHNTIYVNIYGKKTRITICSCGNVKNIKEGIQNKLGIKPEFQELSFNGKLLNDESVNINTLGLKNFSVIDLRIKIREDLENDDNCDFKEK